MIIHFLKKIQSMSGSDDYSPPCVHCACGSYEEDESERNLIPVLGRTGVKRAAAAARVERDDKHKIIKIRIDDRNNPEFWAELDFPWEMLGLVLKDSPRVQNQKDLEKNE